MALARYPHPDSPYSIDHQRSGYAIFHRQHGVVLDEIDCLGDAEGHISQREDDDEQREADELAAEAEYGASHPELAVIRPAPRYTIVKHLGTYEVHDEEGLLATCSVDGHSGRWLVAADADRFPSLDSLPPVFGRCFDHWFNDRGGIHARFGIALPDVSAPVIVDVSREQGRAA